MENKQIKFSSSAREALKAGLALWVEGFQKEIQAIEDQGKTPLFAKAWPEMIKKELLTKLKVQ